MTLYRYVKDVIKLRVYIECRERLVIMFTCPERGAHLVHLFDALPEEQKLLIVATLFFIIGIITPIILRKYKDNTEKQRKEEVDEEIALQLREYQIMLNKHNRLSFEETLEYERMLEEQDLGEFNF